MKAKTFETLLRKIVREEIDYSLQRELRSLKEDLRNESIPTITEHIKSPIEVPNNLIPNNPKPFLKEKIMGKAPLKNPKTQNFTQNSSLNDLLNETARGDTNLESGNSTVNIDKPFSSGAPLPMETTGMPEEVANAMTRDYSGLMKAIDKKKGR